MINGCRKLLLVIWWYYSANVNFFVGVTHCKIHVHVSCPVKPVQFYGQFDLTDSRIELASCLFFFNGK